jgi:hypothetical protein
MIDDHPKILKAKNALGPRRLPRARFRRARRALNAHDLPFVPATAIHFRKIWTGRKNGSSIRNIPG